MRQRLISFFSLPEMPARRTAASCSFPRLPGGMASLSCHLKEISPGISLEGMTLKLKLQYFGHLIRRVDSLEKTDAGRDWGQEEKGMTEDEMAGWHH